MSIDYLSCASCDDNFPDVCDYAYCPTCGSDFCVSCTRKYKMYHPWDEIDEDDENDLTALNYDEEYLANCPICNNVIVSDAELLSYLLGKSGFKTREEVEKEIIKIKKDRGDNKNDK